MARTLVGQFDDAEYLRLERSADGVQQVREYRIARPLASRPARCAYPPEIDEVGLDRRSQLFLPSSHFTNLIGGLSCVAETKLAYPSDVKPGKLGIIPQVCRRITRSVSHHGRGECTSPDFSDR